jgi:hypothetical protein
MHGMSEPTDNHWHLDKKVPISIILVIVMQGIAGLWVVADIKKDVEVLKAAMFEQRSRDERQDKATADAVALVRQDIQEVSRKVDRLIERRGP